MGYTMKELKTLDVYMLSEELSDHIWRIFDSWDRKARNTIGYQIIRAADSIAANLAEGYGRYSYADRRRFYHYARGSLEETKAWLRKAERRKLLQEGDRNTLVQLLDKLGPKLNGFIRSTHA